MILRSVGSLFSTAAQCGSSSQTTYAVAIAAVVPLLRVLSCAEAKMSKEKIWQTVLQGDNPLLSSSIVRSPEPCSLRRLCCTVLYCSVLHHTKLYHTAQALYAVQYGTELYCIVLCRTVLDCTVLYCYLPCFLCQLAKLTAEEDVLALVELLEVTLLYHQQQRWVGPNASLSCL